MHVSKIYLFWRRAAVLMQAAPSIRHVAKVDDDCFLHLPNVEMDLARLACVPDLAYGKVAWISLRQAPLAVCGFSWAAHHLPYQRRGCGRLGFGEPFPFVVGILELLSASLVRYVGTSTEVARSYALASGPNAISTGTTEDPLVGSWVAGAARSGRSLSFVKVGMRINDLNCGHPKDAAISQEAPLHRVVAVHHLKTAGGQHYVWGLLHGRLVHTAANCSRWAGAGAYRQCWTSADPQCKPAKVAKESGARPMKGNGMGKAAGGRANKSKRRGRAQGTP